ncbi:MAG: 3-hydroxyacyl-CoA dehydrogenase NAD-binding domain-containing protein [Alphaproteobacteria bacterium]|nr:3-hydroxyacyl-CoA dehydrogenase NAD-binding domain-containing protein [Alphaproteobacteria bacterium]
MTTSPQSAQAIAVGGAGSIGAAWALVSAEAGYRVHLHELDRALDELDPEA